MQSKLNLQHFQILHSTQYIHIKPNLQSYHSQILINKRTLQIVYEKRETVFTFNTQFKSKPASLILGIVIVEDQYFLLFVDEVYPQIALPDGSSIFQIANLDYIPFAPIVRKIEQQILENIKKEVFSFGFYFSQELDLTLNQQVRHTKHKLITDDRFFWNKAMLALFQQHRPKDEWIVPVIQGHYGAFQLNLQGNKIKYYLISRRSKFRSGARYYSRGINQNGNCANFVETEQIILTADRLHSTVMLSGSPPIFWQQKSVTSSIRLSRRKQLTKGPFLNHVKQLHKNYGRILCLNLMEKKKQDEKILTQAYEQIFSECQKHLWEFCRYYYFDINNSLKNYKNAEIKMNILQLDDITGGFGYFDMDRHTKVVKNMQKGVYRINCLDCLFRTNKMEQFLSLRCCSKQMESLSIDLGLNILEELMGVGQQTARPFIKHFKTLWHEKADYQSLIYTGTRAATSQGNKFLDQLSKSLVSLARLYNQTFNDKIKQKSFDAILNNNTKIMEVRHSKHVNSLDVGIVTWNVNAKNPQKLELAQVVSKCFGCDMIVVGIQEMVDLDLTNTMDQQQETKMKNLWTKALEKIICPQSGGYLMVQSQSMVGLFCVIFISEKWKNTIRGVNKDTVKTGMGGQLGNKGGIVIRINIYQTSICFICSHLAAHSNKIKERIDDFIQIHRKGFQQNKSSIQNQYEIEYSDYCFMFGDLNFRIDGQFKEVINLLEDYKDNIEIIEQLLNRDQLLKVRKDPQTPTLIAKYSQKQISFLPTYKLDKETGKYSQTKNRIPSWCDRILYSCDQETKIIKCSAYDSVDAKGSDHRPVFAKFTLSIYRNQRKNSEATITFEGKQFRDSKFDNDF